MLTIQISMVLDRDQVGLIQIALTKLRAESSPAQSDKAADILDLVGVALETASHVATASTRGVDVVLRREG